MTASSVPNALAQTEDFEFSALQAANNYRRALLTAFAPYLKGDVLEVGAGIGQLSPELRALPSVARLLCIEPDPKFLPRLKKAVPSEIVLAGTAADLPANSDWDAAVSVNVLEHIEQDEAELALYRRLLGQREGHLCLFVPARPEIYAPIDRDFGHFRRYTQPELRTKLEQAGFEIVSLGYYNSIGYFAWWLSFCLLRQRSFSAWSVRLYDRAVFPCVNWLEKTMGAPPFGQSLLAIARARRR